MRQGAKILLAASPDRAIKRMSEVTGMEAKTIHRLLEMKPQKGFLRNEDIIHSMAIFSSLMNAP